MQVKVDYLFEGKSYHFIRSECDFDRNYDDESYAYFIEARNGADTVFFEINILKDNDGGPLTENGYVSIYESTNQVFPSKIIDCKVTFINS